MNLFVAGWNCHPAERERAHETLRAMRAVYPSLDPRTLGRWDEGRGFAAWMHHPGEAVRPRRYVHAGHRELVLYDGTLVDASGTMAAHDAAVLAANWPALPGRLEGRFAALRFDGRHDSFEILNDPFGLHPTFTHARGTTWWVANSVRLLARVAGLDALDLEAMALSAGMYWPGGDRTLVEGVSILPAAQLWAWSGDAEPRRTTYWRVESLATGGKRSFGRREAAHLAEAMGGVLENLAATFGPLQCPITGGRDSRMLTGLMMANGRPTDFFTKGDPHDDDVVIGTAIAGRFGLDHRRSGGSMDELVASWDEVSRRVVQRNDGMVTLMHASNALGTPDHVDRLGVHLYGAAGELARGKRFTLSYVLRGPKPTQATGRVRRTFRSGASYVRPEFRDCLPDHVERRCRSLLDRGFSPVDLPDAFDLCEYGRRWGGAQARQIVDHRDVFLPFFTRAYMGAAFQTPAIERLMERVPFMLLEHVSHDLRTMPGQAPWPPQSAPAWFLARAASVPGKLQASARRRIGRRRATLCVRERERISVLEGQLPRWRARYLDRSGSTLWEVLDRGRFESLTSPRTPEAERRPQVTNLFQVATLFAFEEDFLAWVRAPEGAPPPPRLEAAGR